jgi:hypothetical protein
MDRLKAVEREFRVASDAIQLLRVAVDGRVPLPGGTSPRDLDAVRQQLEATFLIRLWAEFETAVRSYYQSYQSLTTNPQIRAIDLVNTVAANPKGRSLSLAARAKIHEVREYRNSLVHDRDDPVPPVTLSDARRRLNRRKQRQGKPYKIRVTAPCHTPG